MTEKTSTRDQQRILLLRNTWIGIAERIAVVVKPQISAPSARLPAAEELLPLVRLFSSVSERIAAEATATALSEESTQPFAAAVLAALVKVVEEHGDREIRLSSISAIGAAFRAIRDRDRLAAFVPGVSTTLCKVSLGDFKQGKAITSAAIDAWTTVILSVLSEDGGLPVASAADSEQQQQQQVAGSIPRVVRTGAWLELTASRVSLMAERLFAVTNGPPCIDRPEVRASLVGSAAALLSSCGRVLAPIVPLLLDCVVLHADDEDPRVASIAGQAISNFSGSRGTRDCPDTEAEISKLLERVASSKGVAEKGVPASPEAVLEERLLSVLSSLARVSRTAVLEDEKRLRSVKMVNGYIRLLSKRIGAMLTSVLQPLSTALLLLLEVEIPGEAEDDRGTRKKMLLPPTGVGFEHQGALLPSGAASPSYPTPCFRHFRDSRVFKALRETCELLAAHGDPVFLIDHFRGLLEDPSARKIRNQVLLVLGSVAKGSLRIPRGTAVSVVDAILEIQSESEFEGTPRRDTLGAIAVECIGEVCGSVDSETFKLLLPSVLYPVLELLGEGMGTPPGAMAQASWATLFRLSCLCGRAGDIRGLVESNADYIADSLSKKMSQTYRHPNAPHIFSALLKLTGAAFLPFIEDTIQHVLKTLERKERLQSESHIRILHDVVQAIYASPPAHAAEASVPTEERKPMSVDVRKEVAVRVELLHLQHRDDSLEGLSLKERAETVEKFFRERNRKKDDPGEETSDTTTLAKAEAAGPKPSKSLALTKQILQDACVHHLGSSSTTVRVLVLDTIAKGVVVMDREGAGRTGEDGQVMLWPILHSLWGPLTHRLEDKEKVVAMKALDVVQVMALHCGGFLSGRLASSTLPALLSRVSSLASTPTSPKFSWEEKEKEALLRCLSSVYAVVDVLPKHAADMARACVPFLSSSTSADLQGLTIEMLRALATKNPDAVWVALAPFSGGDLPQPPAPSLNPLPASIKALPPGAFKPDQSTRDRVSQLLSFIDSF